ncbi:MAG: hypothetical protein GC153_10400 [Alphaproteobacteria bacterium]|nr:hypothetical protein [Alphaproteobacteria bacterium]
MRIRSLVFSGVFAGALAAAAPSHATVVMAPSFLRVPGVGPTEPLEFQTYNDPSDPASPYNGAFVLGFYNPGITPTSLTADEPDEILTYGAGYPADPTLATQTLFSNDTHYVITGFTLHIAGYAEQQSDDPLDLVFYDDPNVDAVWGDTTDGAIETDIFGSYSISDNGKTIAFTGGHLDIGDIFTDFLYSEITGQHTDFTPNNSYAQNIAYIQASFQGYETPLPAAAPLMIGGLGALAGLMRRRDRSKSKPATRTVHA